MWGPAQEKQCAGGLSSPCTRPPPPAAPGRPWQHGMGVGVGMGVDVGQYLSEHPSASTCTCSRKHHLITCCTHDIPPPRTQIHTPWPLPQLTACAWMKLPSPSRSTSGIMGLKAAQGGAPHHAVHLRRAASPADPCSCNLDPLPGRPQATLGRHGPPGESLTHLSGASAACASSAATSPTARQGDAPIEP